MSAPHTTSSRHRKGKSAVPPAAPAADTAKSGIIADMASRVTVDRAVDTDTKWLMIAEAAYYCAEKRGFEPGHDLEDWLEAEAQIDARVRK